MVMMIIMMVMMVMMMMVVIMTYCILATGLIDKWHAMSEREPCIDNSTTI